MSAQVAGPDSSDALYKNPAAPLDERVQDLLRRMTLEEKIAQIQQKAIVDFVQNGKLDQKRMEGSLGAEGVGTLDAFMFDARDLPGLVNAIQTHLVRHTRLGIPALIVSETLHGLVNHGATIFPQSIGLGSTWNPSLVRQMSAYIAEEGYAAGVRQALAPDLDLAREPRWGRTEETYGEDPYLNGRMGLAYIEGMQGGGQAISEGHLVCTAKHFAAHGSPTGGLNLASVPGGERELRSLYLQPFELAVKQGRVLSVMNAYSSYDGVPAAASHFLLTDILKKEWGFPGYVYSDYESVSMLQTFHHTAASPQDAAQQALNAGVDLEAPSAVDFKFLPDLITQGHVDLRALDEAVARVLRVKFLSDLFAHPYADLPRLQRVLHNDDHVRLAYALAAESIVLLKNSDKLLPLKSTLKSIAVIGPNANQVQFGDYSYGKDNRDGVTILAGIRKRIGSNTRIRYARGCDIVSRSHSGFAEAVEAARKSDVAIVVVGETSAVLTRDSDDATSGEGFDETTLELPGAQLELVKAVYNTHTPTVVVLVNGRPLSLPWIKEHVPAVLEAWYPGEQGGVAIADILFGNVNPSGRLTLSIAQGVGFLPAYYNYLPTDKGYYQRPGSPDSSGRDYVFSSPAALYSFGYGLSYTSFDYERMTLSDTQVTADAQIDIAVDIRNSGSSQGKETIQLYVRDEVSSVVTPVKALKGFEKVDLAPGEKRIVHLVLNVRDLAIYNAKMEHAVEPGEFELMVGAASDDIRLRQIIQVR